MAGEQKIRVSGGRGRGSGNNGRPKTPCLLTRQKDGGQVLVWPSGLRSRFGGVGKGKNEELVEKQAVPIIPSR
ncbi:MAG: hypothetical protein NTX52_09390 [Planctomycetota bacterium]|nr:hypothetical protein [Planctomycetota bacterium]